MKIYQLLHELVKKFVPMDDKTIVELQLKSGDAYEKLVHDTEAIKMRNVEANEFNTVYAEEIIEGTRTAIVPPRLQVQHKIVTHLEAWYFRYLIALAYIFLVPKIKSIINGENRSTSFNDDDDDSNDFEDYLEYKRYKKNLR